MERKVLRKKSRLDHSMDFKRPEKPAVECYKCGRIWNPDPRRWHFFNPSFKKESLVRVVICPACGARNQLSLSQTIELLKFYGMWEGVVKKLGKKKHRRLHAKR